MQAVILRLVLTVCLPILLNGCGAEEVDSDTKKQMSRIMSLAGLGAECNVRNASKSVVIYQDTTVPKSVGVSSGMVCKIAEEMVDSAFKESESGMKELCAVADQLANEFGNGSYSRAITKISSWERSAQTKSALGLLSNCKTNESRFKLVQESVPNHNIYSVGTFSDNGETCLGYLVEMTPQEPGGSLASSKVYVLRGFRECKEFAINDQEKGLFHPEHRPHGMLYGDYVVQSLKYDGEIPDYFNYRGKQYAFYSKK